MWDLETIRHMENVHLQEWLQEQSERNALTATLPPPPPPSRPDDGAKAPQAKFEDVWPLADLARRLQAGPVFLTALIDLLENSEEQVAFLKLVREYLPEHERDILGQNTDDRITIFTMFFNSKYFPLSDNVYEDEELSSFVSEIPVELMGFSYKDYHGYFDFRPGYQLMLSLIVYPYIDGYDNRQQMKNVKKLKQPVGARVPILETAEDMVGREIVKMIPPNGWTPEELHFMVDGTKYAGVANFADWVCSCTGCMVLDANHGDYGMEPWRRGLVDDLTKEYPKVIEIQDSIMKMAQWIEQSDDGRLDTMPVRFGQLVRYLVKNKGKIKSKPKKGVAKHGKGKTLVEVFSEGNDETGGEAGRLRPATAADIALAAGV